MYFISGQFTGYKCPRGPPVYAHALLLFSHHQVTPSPVHFSQRCLMRERGTFPFSDLLQIILERLVPFSLTCKRITRLIHSDKQASIPTFPYWPRVIVGPAQTVAQTCWNNGNKTIY